MDKMVSQLRSLLCVRRGPKTADEMQRRNGGEGMETMHCENSDVRGSARAQKHESEDGGERWMEWLAQLTIDH
jgi:hypothetical protein